MSRSNDDLIEAISRLDMRSWLDSEGVKFRVTRGSHGVQLNIKTCPFCGDSKYRVYMNAETGLGNCFHGDCEMKFTKWKFISAMLGRLSKKDVAEHIIERAKDMGWRPIQRISKPVNIRTEVVMPTSFEIPIKGKNLKYLENRGIDIETAQYFKLRYCLKGSYKYEIEGRAVEQDYSRRIIIPIFNLEGELINYQARDITNTADKKYLFPPGFESTGTHLYNGHNAVGARSIVVNEGAFDVFATKLALDAESELREVVPVGSFGKHLSHGDEKSQLAKLAYLKERGLESVTFMWDGEEQAFEDAVNAALLVSSIGLKARVACLPLGKDPNEVSQSVVRMAYYGALPVTGKLAASKLLLGNPYRVRPTP